MKTRVVFILALVGLVLGLAFTPTRTQAEEPNSLAIIYGLHALATHAGQTRQQVEPQDIADAITSLISWTGRAGAPSARATGTLTYVRDAAGNHNLWYMGGVVNLDGVVTGRVDKHNAVANNWTANVTTMPFPVGGHCAVSIGPYVIVIGGTDSLTSNVGVQVYNTETSTWFTSFDPIPSAMPNGLVAHGCGVLDGTIYVFGGGDPISLLPYNMTWTFDPLAAAGSQWTQLPFTMNHARAGFGYATDAVNGKIYTAGGSDDYPNDIPNELPYVEVFDPATGWTSLPNLNFARTGAALFLAENGTKLVIAGGGVLDPRRSTSSCALPACSSWANDANMNQERAGAAYANINNHYMFVAGGIEVNFFFLINFLSHVEVGR